MIKNKSRIFVIVVGFFFSVLVCMVWLKPETDYSVTERRYLKKQPEISLVSVASGKFMSQFEEYTLDQFPFRDTFRSFKALTLLKTDNNGLYVVDGSIISMEYPLNEDSLVRAGERFFSVYEMYLKDSGSDIYLSIIPDKNYFYAKDNGYLSMDYEKLVTTVREDNEYMSYIDIFPYLSKEDYYKTDTHWKQEKIADVAATLLKAMGNDVNTSFELKQAGGAFYGVYYGQAALNVAPDRIKYLTNSVINNLQVFDYENNTEIPVYDVSKMTEDDPYELFVGGPLSLVTIENPSATTEDELIVFRDSFGSSIAPLLAQGYKKVTLIDIRYIQPGVLKNYVDFENKDVLFLYSTMVLNNSETLK